ncbi:Uncharacterised protein [Candidatus Bilamarchaeum dharawalense]|uniref:Uncharacterized protein n=1 Tax=Candidatus Bilamarchaeum dharawalense TaxID=2885759 RepID=A0A5E4LSV7_9ARCH|nr:Uncharacterised protein [Candidatus Bilamarchaeum dharawalense]
MILFFVKVISLQIDDAKMVARESERVHSAESITLAVDMALNAGLDANVSEFFSVEQNKLHINYEGKLIEVGGVFANNDKEPV